MAFRRRVIRLFLLACVLLGAVWLRVAQLQWAEGDAWRARAREKRTAHVVREAPRGRIVDLDGRVLAEDAPVFHLAVSAGAWRRRGRVRCEACGAVHFHALADRARETCSCGQPGAHLAPLPLADPAPLEDALGLPHGRLTELALDRSEEVRHLALEHRRALEESGWPAFLIGDAVRDFEANLLLRPKVVVRRIPREAVRLVELDEDGRYRGFRVVTDLRRTYPQGDLAAQMLGYVTVVEDGAELARVNALYRDNVTLDSRLGRSGVEAWYDSLLVGRLGEATLLRDEDGLFTLTETETPPQPGKTLRLALTVDACRAAEQALEDHGPEALYAPGTQPSGGFVAMRADTGEIVAWGEMPRFDLAGDLGRQLYDVSQRDAEFDDTVGQWVPRGPLGKGEDLEAWRARLSKPAPVRLSRVAQVAVEPGSTLKTLIGLGMLQTGLPLPYATFECGAWHTSPGCHHHGPVDFEGALRVSCNRYFSLSFRDQRAHWPTYRTEVAALLDDLGLGHRTDVDVAHESAGRWLNDWVDFDPREPARAALELVVPPGADATRVQLEVRPGVPALVAGRGAERLQDVLEKALGEAVAAARGGRVLLRISRGGPASYERSLPLAFEVFAEAGDASAPTPVPPPADGPDPLARAVRGLGGDLERSTLPSGGLRLSFQLDYHDPIGRRPGDPPVVLPDDGRMVAIGQGPVTVTPLQMVRAIATLANGGVLVTPHLALDADGEPLRFPSRPVALSGRAVEMVREGMREVVAEPGGTAYRCGFEAVPARVYGKTGTAQTGNWWTPARDPEKGPWHHWFVGFAESDGRPPLAFACVLHAREEGAAAETAAKAVQQFLLWWFTAGPGTE